MIFKICNDPSSIYLTQPAQYNYAVDLLKNQHDPYSKHNFVSKLNEDEIFPFLPLQLCNKLYLESPSQKQLKSIITPRITLL